MASAITAPTYDPINTATMLADKYVLARQQILDTQSAQASATEKGLNDLSSAMSAFQTSLASLTGLNKSMYAQAATFSDTAVGSASASATAAAGTYSFFVSKLATANQVSYGGMGEYANVGGTLKVKLGTDVEFDVDLGAADPDNPLTMRELAAAINGAEDNKSLVTASVITTGNGKSELVLTAKNTGESSKITLDFTNVDSPDGTPSALETDLVAGRRQVVAAQDAEIHVGSEGGTPIKQASNTFTNIDGVKMTFTKAQAMGSAPVTITVGPDSSATTANVQAFVDAYNKLKSVLDKLTDAGDPSTGSAAGVFAHDGGIRALNDRLVGLLRPSTTGDTLASYGIIATRTGALELRSDRLQRQLALNPTGLDTLIGSASASSPSGIAGSLDKYIKGWSNSADGQIKQRKDATSKLQSSLVDRQAVLDQQHESAYQRYLRQFTALQNLQGTMTNNVSMFDALFGNDKD